MSLPLLFKFLLYDQQSTLSTIFLYAWRSCLCQTRFQSLRCFHHCGLRVRLPCCLCATRFSFKKQDGFLRFWLKVKCIRFAVTILNWLRRKYSKLLGRAYETDRSPESPQNLVQPVGIEPTSTVLQTAAMTTSAKVAYKTGCIFTG